MDNQAENNFIADVIQKSLGVAADKIPADFQQIGWSLPRWHLLMLQDKRRLEFYSEIIKRKVAGKIVLDLGTGSGVLSYLALKWGAKKVYSVEDNPALQAVYRHLMKEPLSQGRAELISDDAKFLRLDQFFDGPPEVFIHELFGSFGMGENLIPIFRALQNEKILTSTTQMAPDYLEVFMRPVWSEYMAKEGLVEAFDGYPLNDLNIFGCQTFWEQDYLASRASNWETTGEAQTLFNCNLRDLVLPKTVELFFKASKCSHLKLWMNIVDTDSGLSHSNDHEVLESHWANSYLTIPFALRGEDFSVEFNIYPDKIEVYRFISKA